MVKPMSLMSAMALLPASRMRRRASEVGALGTSHSNVPSLRVLAVTTCQVEPLSTE